MADLKIIRAFFAFIALIYNFFFPSKPKEDPEVERLRGELKEAKNEELERQKPVTNLADALSNVPTTRD